jgi:FkbM family methyltransferase
MRLSLQRTGEIAARAGVYRGARNVYHGVLRREHLHERRRRRRWYGQFVSPGDLVFDVGAHRGDYAETFRELGARVVAVEANPELAREITRRFPGIAVEAVAVGSRVGQARLWRGRDTEHSTVSPSWARAMPERWEGEISVPVCPLDALIGKHGSPAFCKIDVEGYEHEALLGLHQPLPLLSFELQCAAPNVAVAAARRMGELGSYEFNVVPVGRYELGEWIGTLDLVASEIERIADGHPTAYGDVYARLVSR